MTVESTQKIDIKIPIGNYKVIPVDKLESYIVREIREENVEKIKQSIIEKGYNPSRVLTVVKNGETFFVAAGNHRLQAIRELGMSAVPCLVISGDIYSIAIKDNLDEDTYAPLDLFDWLDIIKRLSNEGLTQKEIGEKIGKTRSSVGNYNTVLEKIDTQILDLCKRYQIGRVSQNDTSVSFDFTEFWFRDNGLYNLNEKYQLECIQRFIQDKCKWKKAILQRKTKKYKQWQEFIEIAKEKLVNEDKLEKLIELIENNCFTTTEQLEDKINSLNKESKNKLIFGDALEELPKIDNASIDLVIIDPPYGADYSSNWSEDSEFISKNGIKNDGLEEALDLLDKTLSILKEKTKANSHFYIFTSWENSPLFREIVSKYLDIKNIIVWHKKAGGGLGDLQYTWGSYYELIIFATKGNKPLNKRKGDVIQVSNEVNKITKIHPTQKPTDLIRELLEVSFQSGDTVCDCFMGSGSTIKATREYDERANYIGIEEDKVLFEKAKAFIFGGK